MKNAVMFTLAILLRRLGVRWFMPGDLGGDSLCLSAGFDITARKQAENALRESEERYRSRAEALLANARTEIGVPKPDVAAGYAKARRANEIAEEIGDRKLTNMVAVGALLAQLQEISVEAVESALQNHMPERHHKLLPMNYAALRRGFEDAKKQLPVTA